MTIKKLLTLTLFAFMCLNMKAQIFTKLDKGINKQVITYCFDSKGNITVLYNSSLDTINIDIWNKSSKKWSNFQKFIGAINIKYKAIYKNDSLYIYGYAVKQNSDFGLFYVNSSTFSYIGRLKTTTGLLSQNISLSIFKNNIVFVGQFDSAYTENTQTNIFCSRVVFFNGNNWVKPNFTNNTIAADNQNNIKPISVAIKDTLYVTLGYGLYKFVYPNTWTKIDNTNNIYGITLLKNEVNFTGLWGDTLYTYKNGNTNSKKLTNGYIYNRNTNCLITHKNKIYMKNGDGWLNELNGSTLNKIYKFDSTDFGSNHIMVSNDTNFYIGNKTPFVYKGKYYSLFTELNIDSISPIGFDTIRGFVFWDKNNNGLKDNNDEFIPGYIGIRNITYGNAGGLFGFDGKFSQIVPNYNNVEYAMNYFQTDTCLKLPFSGNVISNNTKAGVTIDSVYFPLTRTSLNLNNNLILKCYGRSRQRLDDENIFIFYLKNEGCDFNSVNTIVTITIDKDYVITESNPSFNSRNGNVLTYQINGLIANSKQEIIIKGYYPNNKFTLGQNIKHWAKVTTQNSEDTLDNTDTIRQLLSYSYDPNSKHSHPEGRITKELKKIRYTINFQNEGNDDARRVTIIDTLNLKMPVYEFQMVGATHPYSVAIQPGTSVVTWTFNNINLKPKEQNEALSKGYLVFDAKVRGDLRIGDSIRNKAYIYFDYNSPIITNYAVISKVKNGLNIEKTILSKTLSLYPNPAQNYITINSKLDNQKIAIYDMKGALIHTTLTNKNNETNVNISHWAKGIYLLVSQNGESLKFVIQ